MSDVRFSPVPRGCECDCRHIGAPATHADASVAPIAYLVERDGREDSIAICTCCLHEEDRIVSVVASTDNDPDEYGKYDPFGFFLLTREMAARGLLRDDDDIRKLSRKLGLN